MYGQALLVTILLDHIFYPLDYNGTTMFFIFLLGNDASYEKNARANFSSKWNRQLKKKLRKNRNSGVPHFSFKMCSDYPACTPLLKINPPFLAENTHRC
jgi:hypothetical protein